MHPWARERLADARVAHLATISPAGDPHVVPVVFVLVADTVWTAVDSKPKTTRDLKRLANIAAHPRASLLVDHYDEDWHRLWWVRADGAATVCAVDTPDGSVAIAALIAKYLQYQANPPAGPLIRLEVDTWRSWSASGQA